MGRKPDFCLALPGEYRETCRIDKPRTDPSSGGPRPVSPERRWDGFFLLLLVAVAAWKLLYVRLFPYGLSGDEAYYWDWGRRLAFGYYSKPPLIAWLMALGEYLGGSEAAIRSVAAVCGVMGLTFLYLLGRSMYGARTAFMAALLFAFVPGTVALNLLLTIDAPLIAFWTASLWLSWVFLSRERATLLPGVALVVALGLGHLTKQMMWVFPLLVAAAAFTIPGWRGRLQRGRWLPFALSYLALVPNILWNARHEWILVSHTASHIDGGGVTVARQAARLAEFIGSQLLLVGPVAWVLVVVVGFLGIRRFRLAEPATRFLLFFSVPGLLAFLLLALTQRVLPNWPLVFYPAGLLLVVGWASTSSLSRWIRPAIWTGAALSLLLALSPWFLGWTGLEKRGLDPFLRLKGWKTFAEQVDAVADRTGCETWVVVGHRYNTAFLAYYGAGQPRVWRWERPGHIDSQYEIWPGPPEGTRDDTLLIVTDTPENLPGEYGDFALVEELAIPYSGNRLRRYYLFAPDTAPGG